MLVSNKIVDCVALKSALKDRFKNTDLSRFKNKEDFSNFVDIEVTQNIEITAHELANDDDLKLRDEDVISNINEFRDCISNFVDEEFKENQ